MISTSEYIQLKAFARQDGFFIGLLWVFTFACCVQSIKDSGLIIGFEGGIIVTPFIVFYRLKNYRNRVLSGYISYRRALCFTAMTMAYASLILAAAAMAYFYFLDNGALVASLQKAVSTPEIREALAQSGMGKDLDASITMISQLRPVDFAFNILCEGLVSSFLLSLVIALFGRRTPVRVNK